MDFFKILFGRWEHTKEDSEIQKLRSDLEKEIINLQKFDIIQKKKKQLIKQIIDLYKAGKINLLKSDIEIMNSLNQKSKTILELMINEENEENMIIRVILRKIYSKGLKQKEIKQGLARIHTELASIERNLMGLKRIILEQAKIIDSESIPDKINLKENKKLLQLIKTEHQYLKGINWFLHDLIDKSMQRWVEELHKQETNPDYKCPKCGSRFVKINDETIDPLDSTKGKERTYHCKACNFLETNPTKFNSNVEVKWRIKN